MQGAATKAARKHFTKNDPPGPSYWQKLVDEMA
jgi:hypothetical protein